MTAALRNGPANLGRETRWLQAGAKNSCSRCTAQRRSPRSLRASRALISTRPKGEFSLNWEEGSPPRRGGLEIQIGHLLPGLWRIQWTVSSERMKNICS